MTDSRERRWKKGNGEGDLGLICRTVGIVTHGIDGQGSRTSKSSREVCMSSNKSAKIT